MRASLLAVAALAALAVVGCGGRERRIDTGTATAVLAEAGFKGLVVEVDVEQRICKRNRALTKTQFCKWAISVDLIETKGAGPVISRSGDSASLPAARRGSSRSKA